MNRAIYLARPIDNTNHEIRSNLAEAEEVLINLLTQQGHIVYSPARAWNVPGVPAPGNALVLSEVNEEARRQCAVTIAIIYQGMTSVGVPAEIGASLAEGKRVLLVDLTPGGKEHTSYVLVGWLNACRSVRMTGTPEMELAQWLNEHLR